MNNTLIVGSQDSQVYAVPTQEIIKAADDYSEPLLKENSELRYLAVVYGSPLIIVVFLTGALVLSFRKTMPD